MVVFPEFCHVKCPLVAGVCVCAVFLDIESVLATDYVVKVFFRMPFPSGDSDCKVRHPET